MLRKISRHTQGMYNITLQKAASVGKITLPAITPPDARNRNKGRHLGFNLRYERRKEL